MHLFILGLILGWGAAIPIGPINLEIIRRHLSFGMIFGIAYGLGACIADLCYLILLMSGALILLQHPLVLKIIGIIEVFPSKNPLTFLSLPTISGVVL